MTPSFSNALAKSRSASGIDVPKPAVPITRSFPTAAMILIALLNNTNPNDGTRSEDGTKEIHKDQYELGC